MGIGGFSRLTARCARVFAREGLAGILERLRDAARNARGIDYDTWAKARSRLVERKRENNLREVEALAWKPRFGIWIYLRNPEINTLRDAIDSVVAQHYPHWVLCIVEERADVGARALVAQYAAADPRVRRASDAMSVDFVSLLEQDGRIECDALSEMAKLMNADPSLDMVYSDEDEIDAEGRWCAPFFKPDWSPEYLESCPYTGRLAVYRKTLADKAGGFGCAETSACDFDFALRFAERTSRIGHVPRVLYHGGRAGRLAARALMTEAEELAVRKRLARTGRRARMTGSQGKRALRAELPKQPVVSIVIPTAGGDRVVRGTETNLISRCVERIRSASTYGNYEIVTVDNGDLRPDVRRTLQGHGCRFVSFTEPAFNISRKINLGAGIARGEYLLLLNDDTEVISPDWIEAMLEHAMQPGVGVVGAKLLYENGSIQHAGIAHHRGLPDHVRKGFPRDDAGYFWSTAVARNYLAVTGACMLTPAAAFRSVGGFTEAFRINYSDVDYCLKLRERGLRTVYTPHAELYHYESASREPRPAAADEVALYLRRWSAVTKRDPYYNADYLRTAPLDFSLHLRRV